MSKQKAALVPIFLAAILQTAISFVSAQVPAFRDAVPEYKLSFPHDHGAHPDFQTEWWYFTGLLFEEGQRVFVDKPRFGFQLTFFRRAEYDLGGKLQQNYLAHAALSSIAEGLFDSEQRLASPLLDLAGAKVGELDVWNRSWRARLSEPMLRLEYALPTGTGDASLRLEAKLPAAPVLQGRQGFSKKGSCNSCASHYYSLAGIPIQGSLALGASRRRVHGLVWMDHEFMSNALQPDQVGWDWFALSFQDGRRLTLFKLRAQHGGISYASGSIVLPNGEVQSLEREDFSIRELAEWRSGKTGAVYPARWRIVVPRHSIDEELLPLLPQQEIPPGSHLAIGYWEGAVSNAKHSVVGYVEMTGYAQALRSTF